MENNITKKQSTFISEEEKTLNWEEIQTAFKKTLAAKYIIAGFKKSPWLKNTMII